MIKRALALFCLISLILASGINIYSYRPQSVSAANAANWQAGRIIDDGVFTDADAMSVTEIQNFLNEKVGTGGYGKTAGQCDTNGTAISEYGGGTRAEYGAAHGNPAPFTCLKDYYEVPKTSPGPGIPANNYGGVAIPAGAKSAAQLIWDAAHANNISPKVLLVTIQKESAGPLTTDDWPFRSQYTYAMGAHCPDSGPGGSANCDPNYAGFSIQISESASLLRWYLDNMDQPWWTYKKPGNNSILYNPNTGCGSSNVYIQSRATAALYTYTPYQPNQAALNNLYGTGDSCSAYGNRNFWRIFTDWFGTTYNADYTWKYQGQNVYTDSTKQIAINSYTEALAPNTRYYFTLKAMNNGNVSWKKGQIRLATYNPSDRQSRIYDSTWIGPGRAATMLEDTVAPGQTATFEFWVTIPNGYSGKEYFNLVNEGVTWMNDVGLNWVINTANYSWKYQGQNVYTDSTKQTAVDFYNQALAPNSRYYFTLKVQNNGNVAWKKNDTRIGLYRTAERTSLLYDTTWLTQSRPTTMKEDYVAPGQTATFEFWVKTPNSTFSGKEYFNIVREGVIWMNDPGLNWPLLTQSYSWKYQGQNVYTDSTKQTAVNSYTQKLVPNTRYFFTLNAQNTSNVAWRKGNIRLGTSRPSDHTSPIYDSAAWIGPSRAATILQDYVAPGQTATFEFWGTTPGANYTGKAYFNIVMEDIIWLNDPGLNWVINTN
jgi:hypothetical protein